MMRNAILTAFRESDDRHPAVRGADTSPTGFAMVLTYVWNSQDRPLKHRNGVGQIKTVLPEISVAFPRILFKAQL